MLFSCNAVMLQKEFMKMFVVLYGVGKGFRSRCGLFNTCFFQLSRKRAESHSDFSSFDLVVELLCNNSPELESRFMPKMHLGLLYLLIAAECTAIPLFKHVARYDSWKSLQQYRLYQGNPGEEQGKFTLPIEDNSPSMRVLDIEQKRQGFLYGPSLLGNTSWFPTGTLGKAMVQQHMDQWLQDASWLTSVVEEEMNAAAATLKKASSIYSV